MTLEQFFAENREVAIAFSGGVDSAYLLYAATRYAARVKAYYVSTAFQPEFELADARRLADELGADMQVLHADVLSNSAVTANPPDRCYHCKNTLFRQILRAAENDGFPVLLDGTNASDDAGDRPGMRVLRELSVRSPLRECGLTKAEIREIARENDLPVSEKKDSTGVCFIGERNFKQFLGQYLPAQPGEMRTVDGKIVGRHDGLMYYTLGQRRGLGIGGGGDGRRWFVVGKDLPNNVLLVEQGDDSPLLYSEKTVIEQLTWISGHAPLEPGETLVCKARFRHRQPLQDVSVRLIGDDLMQIDFAEKQRAITPGQSAVLYLDQRCLGGGIIR